MFYVPSPKGEEDIVFGMDPVGVSRMLLYVEDSSWTSGLTETKAWIQHWGMMQTWLHFLTFNISRANLFKFEHVSFCVCVCVGGGGICFLWKQY